MRVSEQWQNLHCVAVSTSPQELVIVAAAAAAAVAAVAVVELVW